MRIRRGCYVKDFPRGTTATVRAFDTRDVETVLGDELRLINQRRRAAAFCGDHLRRSRTCHLKITSLVTLVQQPLGVYIMLAPKSLSPVKLVRNPMSAFSLLLNLLWIVFGGLWMAIGWVVAGIVMAITIIGLPWARAAFNIAAYTLLPFGYKAVSRAAYSGQEDIGTGPPGVLGNLVWLLLAGWWLALGHLITAVLLACTIIGIPFAWAHVKLAGLAIWPIGKMIVPAQDAPLRYARRR